MYLYMNFFVLRVFGLVSYHLATQSLSSAVIAIPCYTTSAMTCLRKVSISPSLNSSNLWSVRELTTKGQGLLPSYLNRLLRTISQNWNIFVYRYILCTWNSFIDFKPSLGGGGGGDPTQYLLMYFKPIENQNYSWLQCLSYVHMMKPSNKGHYGDGIHVNSAILMSQKACPLLRLSFCMGTAVFGISSSVPLSRGLTYVYMYCVI